MYKYNYIFTYIYKYINMYIFITKDTQRVVQV